MYREPLTLFWYIKHIVHPMLAQSHIYRAYTSTFLLFTFSDKNVKKIGNNSITPNHTPDPNSLAHMKCASENSLARDVPKYR